MKNMMFLLLTRSSEVLLNRSDKSATFQSGLKKIIARKKGEIAFLILMYFNCKFVNRSVRCWRISTINCCVY